MIRREHDDGRAMLEPAELVALADTDVTSNVDRPFGLRIEDDIKEMQPDAGHQNRGHRHQGQRLAGGALRLQHRPLVLAEQPLYPLERDRIDVLDAAVDGADAADRAVIRRVKAVIDAPAE